MLDMNFGRSAKNTGQEGFDWLASILEIDPDSVVILITAYGDVELAVRAIKNGATDFVLKPWDNEKLLATLSSALRLKTSREENNQLKTKQLGETWLQPVICLNWFFKSAPCNRSGKLFNG